MTQQVRCDNCGAPMEPGSNGRVYVCPYCRSEKQVALEAGQIAAGLRLDLSNIEAFVAELAQLLVSSLGERTRVEGDGSRVVLIELNLDPDVFIARRQPHGIIAQHKKLVRGVALKTTTHPLDRWLDLLTKALAKHANENARVARVLTKIRGS